MSNLFLNTKACTLKPLINDNGDWGAERIIGNLKKKKFGTLLKNEETIFISIDFSQDWKKWIYIIDLNTA